MTEDLPLSTLIDQLTAIASRSKSIPAQMCGEAAAALCKVLDEDENQKKIIELERKLDTLRRDQMVSRYPMPGGVMYRDNSELYKAVFTEQYFDEETGTIKVRTRFK